MALGRGQTQTKATPQPPAIPAEPVNVRRFSLGDLEDKGVWLLNRLRERYPHISEQMFAGWLRGEMLSNECFFVCSPRAVAMAQVLREPLQPQPYVKEVFVLAMDGGEGEAAQMYGEFKRWAKHSGAERIEVGRFSDVPVSRLQSIFGTVYQTNSLFVRAQ